jgi:DNA-binding NarL/FixJ family response regulator
MKLLIVEDDHLQAEWIYQKLKEEMPGAEISCIRTESEFRSKLEEIANAPPEVVLMDVMLRWADVTFDIPEPPEDVVKEKFYRAGLRCERLLAKDERTALIPIIFYTVLERTDLRNELVNLPAHVQYLAKHSDIAPLIHKIEEITASRPQVI